MIRYFRTFAVASLTTFATTNAAANTVRVPGVVDGFQIHDKDGTVDAALVVPTLSTSDILRFDLQGLLGPGETAKAGPITAEVPGNIYIPKQKEKYGWITITLEKPEFGFFTPAGVQQEISAIWFSTPFDMVVDAASGNAKITDLLGAAKFRKAGFAGLKDWSRESKIFLSLDKDLRPLGQITWNRSKPSANTADTLVVFQQTPAGRWALSGFDGNPKSVSSISSVDSLPPRLKLIGVRSTFSDNNLVSAQAWIVEAGRNSKVQFNSVPEPLKRTSLVLNKLKWQNPGGTGWLGVIHQPRAVETRESSPTIFDGLFPLTKLIPQATAGTTITWVDPALEEYEIPGTLEPTDGITLVYVGTTKEVPSPRDEESEPELFTYAQSIRTVVVK